MSPSPTRVLLASSLLLAAGTAHAQTTFHLGPQLGALAATAHYTDQGFFLGDDNHAWRTSYRAGFEAGLVGSLAAGHWAVQPGLLFSQKGFTQTNGFAKNGVAGATRYDAERDFTFSYLTLPLHLAYHLRPDGQGLHVFAGPYASWLLDGRYHTNERSVTASVGTPLLNQWTGNVVGSGPELTLSATPDYTRNFYARRFDAGLQAGLGYRAGQWLLRASYTQGLCDQGIRYFIGTPGSSGRAQVARYSYYHQAFQLSVAYLLRLKG
jgi:hypothetical protein